MILPVLVACLGLRAQAVPPQPLTLEDCIRLAGSVPSAVSVARQEARIAALGTTVARTAFLPQSSLNAGVVLTSASAGNSRFVALNGSREYITTANVGIELDVSGRLRAAYARSKIDRDIAEAGSVISVRDQRRAVTIAFYRLLLTRRLADAAAASLVEARSFEVRTKAMFAGGEVAQADVVKASSQAVAFEQLQQSADLDTRMANQELASFWTADVDARLNIEDTLDQLRNAALSPEPAGVFLKRPEFRIFDLQKRGFTLDARRQRAMLLPQVFVNYQYGIDANTYALNQRGSAAFASVTLPIFDWFRARSLSNQFSLKADQTTEVRALTQRVFSREYESARTRVSSFLQQTTAAESQMRLSVENFTLSRLRYEGGEGAALDVVLAQTQLQQARANYFNTLFLYAAARADLEVAAGR